MPRFGARHIQNMRHRVSPMNSVVLEGSKSEGCGGCCSTWTVVHSGFFLAVARLTRMGRLLICRGTRGCGGDMLLPGCRSAGSGAQVHPCTGSLLAAFQFCACCMWLVCAPQTGSVVTWHLPGSLYCT